MATLGELYGKKPTTQKSTSAPKKGGATLGELFGSKSSKPTSKPPTKQESIDAVSRALNIGGNTYGGTLKPSQPMKVQPDVADVAIETARRTVPGAKPNVSSKVTKKPAVTSKQIADQKKQSVMMGQPTFAQQQQEAIRNYAQGPTIGEMQGKQDAEAIINAIGGFGEYVGDTMVDKYNFSMPGLLMQGASQLPGLGGFVGSENEIIQNNIRGLGGLGVGLPTFPLTGFLSAGLHPEGAGGVAVDYGKDFMQKWSNPVKSVQEGRAAEMALDILGALGAVHSGGKAISGARANARWKAQVKQAQNVTSFNLPDAQFRDVQGGSPVAAAWDTMNKVRESVGYNPLDINNPAHWDTAVDMLNKMSTPVRKMGIPVDPNQPALPPPNRSIVPVAATAEEVLARSNRGAGVAAVPEQAAPMALGAGEQRMALPEPMERQSRLQGATVVRDKVLDQLNTKLDNLYRQVDAGGSNDQIQAIGKTIADTKKSIDKRTKFVIDKLVKDQQKLQENPNPANVDRFWNIEKTLDELGYYEKPKPEPVVETAKTPEPVTSEPAPAQPAAVEGSKQPWEMTKDEWIGFGENVAEKVPHVGDIQTTYRVTDTINNLRKRLREAQSQLYNANTPDRIGKIKADIAKIEDSIEAARGVESDIKSKLPAAIEQHNKALDDWMLEHPEYKQYFADIVDGSDWHPDLKGAKRLLANLSPSAHYNFVERALSKGKPVPAEVMADYPDLAAKYGKPTEVNPKIAESQAKIKAALDRFGTKAAKAPSGIDPSMLPELVEVGYHYAKIGGLKFAEWSAKMVTELGEAIRPYLQQLWDEIGKGGDTKQVAARLASKQAEATTTAAPTVTTQKAKPAAVKQTPKPATPVAPVEDAVGRLTEALKIYKKNEPLKREMFREQRGQRFKQVADARRNAPDSDSAIIRAKGALKGELDRPPVDLPGFEDGHWTTLKDALRKTDLLSTGEWLSAEEGLRGLVKEGKFPQPKQRELLGRVFGPGLVEAMTQAAPWYIRAAKRTWIETNGILRAMQSTGDMSWAFLQGFRSMVTHPQIWARGAGRGFKAFFSEKVMAEAERMIRTDPLYDDAVDAKLYLSEMGDHVAAVNRPDEWVSSIIHKIPGINVVSKASNRHWNTMSNSVRFGIFKKHVELLEANAKRAGKEGVTPYEMRDAAKYANILTGRGYYGKFERVGAEIGAPFYSLRNLVAMVEQPAAWMYQSPVIRKQAIKDCVKLASFMGTAMTMAKLSGQEVEDDILSSNFGKMKKGKTYIDLTGGFGRMLSLVAQIGAGKRKDTKTGKIVGSDPVSTTAYWLSYKAAPPISLGLNLSRGKTPDGEEFSLSDPANVASKTLLPLVIQDIRDAWEEEGAGQAAWVSPLAFTGVRASTYNDSPGKQSGYSPPKYKP